MAEQYKNPAGLSYPLTNMNFLVSVEGVKATAAFSEVNGIDATVETIDFRQGNSHSLSAVKVPGLVKHGPITLKFGYTLDNDFKEWVKQCVSETRGAMPRSRIQIELIDTVNGAPKKEVKEVKGNIVWILTNAFVSKYTAPMLNAMATGIAYESVTVVYEELVIPNKVNGSS